MPPKKIFLGLIFVICLVFLLLFWNNSSMQNPDAKIRYVALGDSYSNGEGAGEENAWPVLLTNHLKQEGYDITLIANLSVSGWTTQNVIDGELPEFIASHPTFASLLIGANDTFQGVDAATFKTNFISILDTMQKTLPDPKKILILTIPDYSVSPQVREHPNAKELGEEIVKFNAIIREEAAKRDLPVVELYELARAMGTDRSLSTEDGLHPSAKELKIWEAQIYPSAEKLLKE
jgi:acyl-CoA thioesterase I